MPDEHSLTTTPRPNGPNRPVTIYDVAEQAGVSIATVSHALNKPSRVAAATLERVLGVIDELGFTPKAMAVSRARQGVGRIGVIAPFSSYDSFRIRLLGVLAACANEPMEVVVYDHESVAEATSPLLGSLPATGRLDGLLIMGVPLQDSMADRLTKRQLPTVLVDSFHPELTSVNVDDERGGWLIAEHLLKLGHRTFAYVSERQQSMRFVSPAQRRIKGFTAAITDAGLDPSSLRHVIATHDVAGGRTAAAELLGHDTRPDAVVAHFDEIAAGLLLGFRTAGLRTPDDIAVVGYDDGSLAQALDLTTVRQPLVETGHAGAELLLEAIVTRKSVTQQLLLSPELVVRATG